MKTSSKTARHPYKAERAMPPRTIRAAEITPENLDVVILQDRSWIAIWCGPKKRKLGHWFLYAKRRKSIVLRTTIHDVSRVATLKELIPFATA